MCVDGCMQGTAGRSAAFGEDEEATATTASMGAGGEYAPRVLSD